MKYTYRKRNKGSKYHIADGNDTLCKLSNGGFSIKKYIFSNTIPSKKRLCKVCGDVFAGKKVIESQKHKRKFRKSNNIYSTYQWKKLRYEVLLQSDGCCSLCGASKKDGIVLNVDHIKPLKFYPELAFCKENLQVLCSSCNWGKGNWDDTNWARLETWN